MSGRYYNADGTSARTYPANGPSELFALWQPKTTTITFNGNGGNIGGTTSLTATYGQPLPDMLSPLPTRTGYAFAGCKALNPVVEYYDAQGKGTKPWDREDASVTLFAQWGVINYTVRIDANGGTGGTSTFSSNYGAVPLVNAPTRTGFSFAGWKVTGVDGSSAMCGASSDAVTTPIDEGGVYGGGASSFYFKQLRESAGTVTLAAQWAANEYAITYNGLPDGATHSNPATYTIETETIVFTAPSEVAGYKFTGWSPTSIAKGSTGNQTVTASYLTMVEKPTAATGLVYNGTEQTGVAAATGYSVANGKATNAGDYTATATLTDGYCWSDGTTDNASISWSIAKAAIVASAADVEKEYDGVAAHIAVTVTTPASGATVTYSLTEDGEYTGTNPSFTEFGAYRVYWKASAPNHNDTTGSAMVRIAKKAVGKYVRLTITKRKGGDSVPEGQGGGDFELGELALYDAGGTRLNSGLALATEGLAQLKATSGTCYSFPVNWYGGQGADKLFNENKTSPVKLCCPRNSTSSDSAEAHIQIYMHLSDENADKVICSYNLQSGDDVANSLWRGRSPTAWRLEVSSDCERWTIIDEKTVADTKDDRALNTNNTWYNGGTPYRINLDYVPMEVLETNPYAEGTEAYKKVMNYIQIVGFQLDKDNVVTTRVQFNDDPESDPSKRYWDTIFSQRDSSGEGMFSVYRRFGGMDTHCVRFDYGDRPRESKNFFPVGECEFIASPSGLKVNGAEVELEGTMGTWRSTPDNSLLLFISDNYSNLDGVPCGNQAYLKCYYFKVADSTAAGLPLRLDLVPASNTVSHAQGLYDRVSGNFYPLQDATNAGKTTLSGSNTQVTFSKELTAIKDETAGWNQFPLVTEVTNRVGYLTSIPDYWQQEWVPNEVTGPGEYRLVMRGQGPYKGAVTNVYTVRARVALDANGGTAGATNSVLVLPGKALPNITGAGALPTRVGHLFVGYFDDATGTKYYNADGTCMTGVTYPMADGPTALMAHWLVDLAQAKVLTTAVPVSPWPPAVTVEVGDGSGTRLSSGFAVTSDPATPVVGGSCTFTLTGDGVTCTGTQTATVRVNPAAPEVVAGATMWFDAADAAKLTLSTEAITTDEIALGEGVTFVTNWMKSAGEVDHMSALTNYYGQSSGSAVGYVRKGNRPTLGTMPNGNHYLDFGSVLNIAKAAPMPSGYGAGMGWFDENGKAIGRNDIRDVYMVVMDDEGCNARRSGSCQYQHFLGTAKEDGTATSFLRLKDYGYVLGDGDISSNKADDSFLNGTISIDGLSAGVRTIYPTGFHVLRLASDGGAGSAGALCSYKSDAQGGLKYGELIVFDTVQSDANAAAIINYLYEKWLGTAPRNDIRIRLDNGSLAAEKITDGYVVCRNGGAMQELPVKYVDSESPYTTFVRGTFVGYYDANGVKYYGKDGLPVSGRETCAFTADTTLNAHYAYILPAIRADGPTVEVETGWMKSVCPGATSVNDYKSAFLEPNGNGVKVWQAYVLGHEPGEVNGAKIVEETAQNANPETVTIRLCGLPESPRTNATTRLAYSLYAARTPEGFAKGEDALGEKNGDTTPFEKSEKSTFEAPLSDLTDEEPVNYYRIKVHFIFGGAQ